MAVELSELIEQLRTELATSMRAGRDSDVQFELGPVELELEVAVEKEAKPGAKVRFYVMELGGEGRLASTNTQRIKLTLEARPAGEPGRRLMVSGEEAVGER
ncbi:trypco2 family protein [Streptomyces sp. NPDC127166]|uniref:trypco2 family protein n=1 Tax=Streptomyces sp. NPDC127166 TaxID=3345380 RepID=UPI003636E53E